MQNPTHIFKQFRPLQNLLAKITTVQKPCIDRAIPDFSGLHNKKEKAMENFHRFTGASCLTRTGDTLINSQVL